MKAEQLMKVLQIADPDDEIFFSVGNDKEERKDLLKMVGGNPDIFIDMKAESVEISEIGKGKLRIDICLYPIGVVPEDF